VCYQVVIKGGKIVLIHTSKFFTGVREKDGSLPFYWRPTQQSPRGGAEEPMRLYMSSDVEFSSSLLGGRTAVEPSEPEQAEAEPAAGKAKETNEANDTPVEAAEEAPPVEPAADPAGAAAE